MYFSTRLEEIRKTVDDDQILYYKKSLKIVSSRNKHQHAVTKQNPKKNKLPGRWLIWQEVWLARQNVGLQIQNHIIQDLNNGRS